MDWRRIIVGCAALVATASGVHAAPFCIQVTGIPLQCLYVDPSSCQREANRQGGLCASNPDEFKTPAGGAQFCLVESGNVVSCTFADRSTCTAESRRRNAACIAATPLPPGPTASAPLASDLFEVNRPY